MAKQEQVEEKKEHSEIVLSVNKLMNLFRDSLLSVSNSLENAQINWQSFFEYEQIDAIAESLFTLIIMNKLTKYVENKYSIVPTIPKYGFYLKDYKKFTPIEIDVSAESFKYVFVMFNSKSSAFDTILCNKINNKGEIIERDVELSFENHNFLLRFDQ